MTNPANRKPPVEPLSLDDLADDPAPPIDGEIVQDDDLPEGPDGVIEGESLNGVPILSRSEFRHWYAGRFRLVNTVIAPFVGGRLAALDVKDTSPDLKDAADALYDTAIKREWLFVLKRTGGVLSMLEANGGLIFGIAIETTAEINLRKQAAAEAAQAQANAEGNGDGGAAAEGQPGDAKPPYGSQGETLY